MIDTNYVPPPAMAQQAMSQDTTTHDGFTIKLTPCSLGQHPISMPYLELPVKIFQDR